MYILYLVLFLVVLYILVIIYLYISQEKHIFKGSIIPLSQELDLQYEHTEHFYTTSNEGHIHSIFFQANIPSEKVIFYLHGTRGHLEFWEEISRNFTDRGWNCLMIDYRGYGKSRGSRTSEVLINDVYEIYQQTLDKYNSKDIIIYGRSLGSTFASALAKKYPSKRLFLETPIYSIERQAKLKFDLSYLLPIKQILKYSYDNALFLKNVTTPITIIHGTKDETVPLSEINELMETMPKADLTIVEGGEHSNLFEFEEYHSLLDQVLS